LKPANDKVIVRVNMAQKDTILVGGIKVSTAMKFETNYREKSPVVAEIVQGNKYVKPGQIGLFHHNHFYPPSKYGLYDDLYSVPFNRTMFGTLDGEGNLNPMCENIICERVWIESTIPLPISERKTYIDRAICLDPGWTKYKKGQLLFHRLNAGYDIVYNWNGIEKRVTKIHAEFIVGVEDITLELKK
jgi:hypothetical protein